MKYEVSGTKNINLDKKGTNSSSINTFTQFLDGLTSKGQATPNRSQPAGKLADRFYKRFVVKPPETKGEKFKRMVSTKAFSICKKHNAVEFELRRRQLKRKFWTKFTAHVERRKYTSKTDWLHLFTNDKALVGSRVKASDLENTIIFNGMRSVAATGLSNNKLTGASIENHHLFSTPSYDTHAVFAKREFFYHRKASLIQRTRKNKLFRTVRSLQWNYYKRSTFRFWKLRKFVIRNIHKILNRGQNLSTTGLWFNITKIMRDTPYSVRRRLIPYRKRADRLFQFFGQNNPYKGSSVAAAIFARGTGFFKYYNKGNLYYNNVVNYRPLGDYFSYEHGSEYTPLVMMYPEHNFEVFETDKEPIDKPAYDNSLLEFRTKFWTSYVGTPTCKNSWVRTVVRVIANTKYRVPLKYVTQYDTVLKTWGQNMTKGQNRNFMGVFKNVSLNRLRKRYFRKSWRVILRLRFERFIFNKVKFPVYIWFHNVWGLFFKRFYKWRRFESRSMASFTKKSKRGFRSLALRTSWYKMLLRSLGLLGVIVGSIHCFTYVFSFLLVKFRKHWQVLKLIKRQLRRCIRLHRTISGIRVIVAGRFTGIMRARKSIFRVGGKIKYMNYSRRLTHVLFNSQTPWGVFGIRIWAQFKPKRLRVVNEDKEQAADALKRRGYPTRKTLLRYSRRTVLELTRNGFGLRYYTNDDIKKKRHLDDIHSNYAIEGTSFL